MHVDFTTVTELPGDEVSSEQIGRIAHRYCWAAEYCQGLDVVEIGCGAGQGLGYLASVARSLRAGDITPSLVARARAHYGSRVEIVEMDAQEPPLPDRSVDVVIFFEAIYYLSSPERFVEQCRRILRPGGHVLIVAANKDLYDFNPSPFSHRNFGVPELRELFGCFGFSCQFFGVTPIDTISVRQKLLRPIKMLAVRIGLMPRTMAGKKWLKRVVFGKLMQMPAEIDVRTETYEPPVPVPAHQRDRRHKVIYLTATLPLVG